MRSRPLCIIIGLSLLVLGSSASCSSKGRIVEYRENFLHISVKPDHTEAICDGDPEATFFGVYAVIDGVLYDFFFRRPWDSRTCQERLLEYKSLMKSSSRVELVGIEPSLVEDFKKYENQHPKHLGKYDREVSVIFVRAHGNGTCMSYFDGDCDSSKYWGGVIPGKKMTK